jgi:hypothetical protein
MLANNPRHLTPRWSQRRLRLPLAVTHKFTLAIFRAVAQLWIVRPMCIMTESKRPFLGIVAVGFHFVGILAAGAVASKYADRESLQSLVFFIPTYAVFCLLATVSAGIAVWRVERLRLLWQFMLLGGAFVSLWLFSLVISRWSLGFEIWKQKI